MGEATEANARASLRKVLAELRQQLPAHLIFSRSEVVLDRASPYWLDVEAFERQASRARSLRNSHLAGCVEMIEQHASISRSLVPQDC